MPKKSKAKPVKRKQRNAKKPKKKFFLFKLFAMSFTALFWAFLLVGMVFVFYANDLPDLSEFAQSDRKPQITIRDANGIVLAKYGDAVGKSLTYSQIPQPLIQAIVATEDQRFFDHFGFDIWGIIRANLKNIKAGRYAQGGSTITQQLAKVVYLTPEKTLKRKILEVMISLQLEKKFTKEQILTLYLNRIYLGSGNFGIDAASRFYFGKSAEDLDLYESAVLAGMAKAPSRYSPSNNPELSFERAKVVLTRMTDEGYITKSEARTALPPKVIKRGIARGALKNPYFTDYVLNEASDLIENPNQDLDIYTTLDIHAQEILEDSIKKQMQAYAKANVKEAAAIVMEPNGAIKAMVGGTDYRASQFNRAVSSKRQPASAFKLLVYLAALENGYSPSDTVNDIEISYHQGPGLPKWSPNNFNKKFNGSMSLEDAFAKSINTVAVQVSEKIGRDKVVEMAQRLGVESSIPSLPSIALGAVDISLLEITQAYAHVANNGLKTKAYSVLQIVDADDNILYSHPKPILREALNDYTVSNIKQMLGRVIERGTGRNSSLKYKLSYGKTGTSQGHKDAWFIGFTNELVAGFWAGNDDNVPMKNISGGTITALMWKDFMTNVGDLEKTKLPESMEQQKSIFDILF